MADVNAPQYGASLMGIPKEIGSYVSGFLPRQDIARMQRTNKRTKEFTAAHMKRICDSLPDEDELLSYVNYLQQIDSEEKISSLNITNNSIHYGTAQHTGEDYYIQENDGWLRLLSDDDSDISWRDIWSDSAVSKGIPDPRTVLSILRRRTSCRKEYIKEHGKDEYGLDIVRNYQRGVLRRYLEVMIGRNSLDLLYEVKTTDLGQLVTNIDSADEYEDRDDYLDDLKDYQQRVQRLRIIVWFWLQDVAWEDAWAHLNTEEENPAENDTPENLMEEAQQLVKRVFELDERLPELLQEIDKIQANSLPTHSELIEWIKKKIRKEEDFRIAFLHKWDVYELTFFRNVFSLDKIVRNETKPTYRIERTSSIVSDVSIRDILFSKIEDPDNIFEAIKQGFLDPNTMLTIMRDRSGHENEIRYGIADVREFLDRVMGAAGTKTMFSSQNIKIDNEVYLDKLRNTTKKELPKYVDTVQKLRLVAVWAEAGTSEQRNRWYLPRDINNITLYQASTELFNILGHFRVELADVAGGDEVEESDEEEYEDYYDYPEEQEYEEEEEYTE